MRKRFSSLFLITVLCTVLLSVPAEADTMPQRETPELFRVSMPAALYVEDRISLQLVTGAVFSPIGIGPETPTYNYQMTNARLGWMLNTPHSDVGPLTGNVEAILELSASGVFSGFGNYMVGPTALVRYNFVQPGWRVVPYIQGGAGIVLNDAYEDKTQGAIGQFVQFTPQASIGTRILVTDNWSVDLEAIFHHVSNARMANRNLGTNGLGGMIGFTYFFNQIWD